MPAWGMPRPKKTGNQFHCFSTSHPKRSAFSLKVCAVSPVAARAREYSFQSRLPLGAAREVLNDRVEGANPRHFKQMNVRSRPLLIRIPPFRNPQLSSRCIHQAIRTEAADHSHGNLSTPPRTEYRRLGRQMQAWRAGNAQHPRRQFCRVLADSFV